MATADRPVERVSTTLFVGGDAMLGRGIDQILPHPSDPVLHESYVKSARGYVALAERANGPVPAARDAGYVWGDALEALAQVRPDARIVNLETAVTAGGAPWPGKGIHYRMHPANVGCLRAAAIDCCVLANNHALDWGRQALGETIAALSAAGIRTAGAGDDADAAAAPATLALRSGGCLRVFACCTQSSGVPADWAAGAHLCGVNLLPDLDDSTADSVAATIHARASPGDLVALSIHWGGNWGYAIPQAWRRFAHRLVDAGVALVHGHSSHHPLGIEVYRERAILYGCGDLLNDYEGIGGHEVFRPDLSLMYFPRLEAASGRLLALEMRAMSIGRLRLNRAGPEDTRWLAARLAREGRGLGTAVTVAGPGSLSLRW